MLTEFWSHKGWIALVPLALAALAFYAWIAIGGDARAMERGGVETQATITDTRRTVRPATTGDTTRLVYNYYVTVMFTTGSAMDDTMTIRPVEHFVDRDYYEDASVGDRVWVRYLPDDPSQIELVRGGTQSNSNAAGYVALGMVGIAAALGWLIWANAAKHHRFKTRGTETTATITDTSGQNGWTVLSLTLPDGRAVKALPVRSRNDSFAIGATITVLTEPGNAGQVLIPPTR